MCSRLMLVFVVLCLAPFGALAQVLLESDTGRTEGFFTKKSVYQRAIMLPAAEKSDTAVLFYPGSPGIVWMEPNSTYYPPGFNTPISPYTFQTNNISLIMMDCPTDEWGEKSYYQPPTGCDDTYRKSERHAEDARLIIKKLKTEFNITKIYLMGHSHGTISVKWLGRALGNEIDGVINSGASTVGYRGAWSRYAWSVVNFDMKSIKVPALNVHHEKDGCEFSPYSTVLDYSTNNLITVRGGIASGDPCRSKSSYHSYGGLSDIVSRAIINWIKTREVPQFIGDE